MNRRFVGIFLTFLASGVVHPLIFTAGFPDHGIIWEYSFIFLISPFVVASENLLKAYIRKSESLTKATARVPRIARIVFVHICTQIMAHYTFFPSLRKVGFVEKSIDALFSSFKLQSPKRRVDAMN